VLHHHISILHHPTIIFTVHRIQVITNKFTLDLSGTNRLARATINTFNVNEIIYLIWFHLKFYPIENGHLSPQNVIFHATTIWSIQVQRSTLTSPIMRLENLKSLCVRLPVKNCHNTQYWPLPNN